MTARRRPGRYDWVSNNLRWLIAARGVRSFSQAVVTIAVPLYLAQSGYDAWHVGLLLSLSSAGAGLLILAVGLCADRYGRRPTMIALAALAAAGCMPFALGAGFWPLVLGAALTTVGRGGSAAAGGTIGPFFPAEQPLIAGSVSDQRRNDAFAAVTLAGVVTGAAGSLCVALPAWLRSAFALGWLQAYQVLFWIGVVSCLCLIPVILPIVEGPRPEAARQRLTAGTWSLLGRLSLTNGLNGVSRGLLGPFLAYWFLVRFGVGPAQLGIVFAIASLAAAAPLVLTSRVARALGGSIQAIVLTRCASAALIGCIALMPSFALAGVCLVLRTVVTTLGVPLRQSYVMGVSDEQNRSVIAAFSNLPSQATSVVAPSLGAYLLNAVDLASPIWLAALFQLANGLSYLSFFRHLAPPEERAADAGTAG